MVQLKGIKRLQKVPVICASHLLLKIPICRSRISIVNCYIRENKRALRIQEMILTQLSLIIDQCICFEITAEGSPQQVGYTLASIHSLIQRA